MLPIGTLREIELDFMPSPSGAAQLLLHGEEQRDAYLLFLAHRFRDKADLLVLATFHDCRQSVFGYPNDEAVFGSAGYGIYAVENSTWEQEINAYNEVKFPGRSGLMKDVTHYFVIGHDQSSQFLAQNFTVEVLSEDRRETGRYERGIALALSRMS